MFRAFAIASLIALAAAGPAAGQQLPTQIISGTRLDIVASGQVKRVPDIVRISAGVVTQAPTASAALAQNAQQMTAVLAALKRAGIAERDIQTSSIGLNPEYRYIENRTPQLIGYRASNEVSVRFRDIGSTGKIIDALVAQGANQISGPMLGIDKPEEALDEARTSALASARARAEIYARNMGMRVKRILSVSEAAGDHGRFPQPMIAEARAMDAASTPIRPGEQTLGVVLSVSFELE